MRDTLSVKFNKRRDQSVYEARGNSSFVSSEIELPSSPVYTIAMHTESARPHHNGPSACPFLSLSLSLSFSLTLSLFLSPPLSPSLFLFLSFSPLSVSFSLSLSRIHSLLLPFALTPRNEIMVIDYPTWKPPSGISITYVCIPTGNLPLIRSNSAVTQFTPASNLKWDCLMAQGTIEMDFSDFAGSRSPFETIARRTGIPL